MKTKKCLHSHNIYLSLVSYTGKELSKESLLVSLHLIWIFSLSQCVIFVLSLRVLLSLEEISVMFLNPVWTDFQWDTDSWKLGFSACEVGPFGTRHTTEQTRGEAASGVVVKFPKQCIPSQLSWAWRTSGSLLCWLTSQCPRYGHIAYLHVLPSGCQGHTCPTVCSARPCRQSGAVRNDLLDQENLAAPRNDGLGWEKGERPGDEEGRWLQWYGSVICPWSSWQPPWLLAGQDVTTMVIKLNCILCCPVHWFNCMLNDRKPEVLPKIKPLKINSIPFPRLSGIMCIKLDLCRYCSEQAREAASKEKLSNEC